MLEIEQENRALVNADLAYLHEDIDAAQEVGGGQSGAGVAACHVVLIQVPLPLAQSTPVYTDFTYTCSFVHLFHNDGSVQY